jgi:DNA polymerase I-like protein with 3'-5' exonuclease and polymerase domains
MDIHPKNLRRFIYNGKDCLYTHSIALIQQKLLKLHDQPLQDFYHFQQHEVAKMVLVLMNRGIKVDVEQKEAFNIQFTALMETCLEQINYICMEEVNLNSSAQVKRLFKDLLGIKPILDKKTKSESFNANAMLVYLEQYPEWRTLLTLFLEYKSIKVFVRTFLAAKLDDDGRMRCDYNPAGTKTYRLSSRKNVFGRGANLANIPSKGKLDLKIALQEYNIDAAEDDNSTLELETDVGTSYEGTLQLPNVKKIFIPDSKEWMFFDADYSAIDLMFVIWESDCKFLKDIIHRGEDVYSILASHYYQREITKNDDERQIFKSICHGKNYLGQAPTLAAKAGLHIGVVKRVLDWYDRQCPEIGLWHKRVEQEARKYRCVRNIWGARFECTDFSDPMWLNKMVACVPQSSAAILVNKAIVSLEKAESKRNLGIRVFLQVHDSLSGQYHISDINAKDRIKRYMEIVIPYKDPLIIPASIKVSNISYGNCT